LTDTSELTPEFIDSFISVEIPNPSSDPLEYALVAEHMVHGPCGRYNPWCSCMKNGRCSYGGIRVSLWGQGAKDFSYSDESIQVALWGQRAKDFSISHVSAVSHEVDAKPIMVLFVGCLVKNFKGMYFLPTNITPRF
jgi:hypothetical protein